MSHSNELLTREMLPDIYTKVAEAVKELEKNPDAIEETSMKGYESTGYRYQFIADILNDVIGSNHWTLESEELFQHGFEKVGNQYKVVLRVKFTIGNWIPGSVDGTTTSFFEILDQKEHYGDGANKAIGDAYKGAVTNGFKKALGLAGIGNRAFTGELARAFGKDIDVTDEGLEVTSRSRKGETPKGLKQFKTAYYDPTKPYAQRRCHKMGLPIDQAQMEFCIKEKIRPSCLNVISPMKGDFTSIKLTEEELQYVEE